jgi:hypothetical protein
MPGSVFASRDSRGSAAFREGQLMRCANDLG